MILRLLRHGLGWCKAGRGSCCATVATPVDLAPLPTPHFKYYLTCLPRLVGFGPKDERPTSGVAFKWGRSAPDEDGQERLHMSIRVGSEVWLPCQVKRGPFSNEKLVRISLPQNAEWVGFVAVNYLKDPEIENGETQVLTRVTKSDSDSVTLIVQGHALDSRYVNVPKDRVQRVPVTA